MIGGLGAPSSHDNGLGIVTRIVYDACAWV